MANKWPTPNRLIDCIPIRQQELCGGLVVALGSRYDAQVHVRFEAGDSDLADELVWSDQILSVGQWIPKCAPHSDDAFCGLNRSVDAYRLAGLRIVGTGLPINEGVLRAAVEVVRYGGHPDLLVLGPENYAQLQLASNYWATPVQFHPRGQFNYICVEPDLDDVFILQSDTWAWHDIASEARWEGQLVCTMPGFNARLTP